MPEPPKKSDDEKEYEISLAKYDSKIANPFANEHFPYQDSSLPVYDASMKVDGQDYMPKGQNATFQFDTSEVMGELALPDPPATNTSDINSTTTNTSSTASSSTTTPNTTNTTTTTTTTTTKEQEEARLKKLEAKKKSIVCIQRQEADPSSTTTTESWNNKNCRTVLLEDPVTGKVQTKCECSKMATVTVVEDTDHLFTSATENVEKVFSAEAIAAIAAGRFLKTYLFYVLCLQTLIYLYFLVWGWGQDIKELHTKEQKSDELYKVQKETVKIAQNKEVIVIEKPAELEKQLEEKEEQAK